MFSKKKNGALTALSTVVIATFTISLALDSHHQAKISQRTLHAIKGQLTEMNKASIQTNSVIKAAEISAQAAKDAVGLERAWIGAPKLEPVEVGENTYEFDISIKNIGKRFIHGLYIGARLVHLDVKSELRDEIDKSRRSLRENIADNGEIGIVPGEIFVLRSEPEKDSLKITFNPVAWEQGVNNGEFAKSSAPYIVGCILYRSEISENFDEVAFVAKIRLTNKVPKVVESWVMSVR